MGIKSNGISAVLDYIRFTRKPSRMGFFRNIQVVQLGVWLLLLLIPESSSSLCHRRQYWHEEKEKCVNCTTCQAGEIVIRPCQVHRDAHCGPISELNIDWSFLPRREHKHNPLSLEKPHHEHHKHHHKHHRKTYQEKLLQGELSELKSQLVESQTGGPEANTLLLDSAGKAYLPESAALHHLQTSAPSHLVEASTRPFSPFERMVWDWQVVVLVLAVVACVLFFLVTGIYTIHHFRQWRRFKNGFKPDAEEMYARKRLVLPGQKDSSGPSFCLESYALQQSLCMEQLLVLKTKDELGTVKGNFYIIRDKAYEIQEESQ